MNYAELMDDLEGIIEECDNQRVKVIVDGEFIEVKKLIDLNGIYYLVCDDEE